MARVDRNQSCPCGSGRRFKHCCLSTRKLRAASEPGLPPAAADPPDGVAPTASTSAPQPAPPAPAAAAPSAACLAALADKQRFYAKWIDEPLDSLQGLTPRQAAKHPRAWRKLEVVLKVKEHVDRERPPGERFDFAALRRELGLRK